MKIIVFGASGSGTTTLAKSLAERLSFRHLDVDDFYWVQTAVPFQIKIARSQRVANLRNAMEACDNAVVSGSLISWGDYFCDAFDLAIFLTLPRETRMERLKHRELERYGDRLFSNPDLKAQSKAFLDWAREYDNPLFSGRNIAKHKKWAESLACKCVEIGDLTNEQRIDIVISVIDPK